jgi:hypothetical protein
MQPRLEEREREKGRAPPPKSEQVESSHESRMEQDVGHWVEVGQAARGHERRMELGR